MPYNPRWLAYCRAMGLEPEVRLPSYHGFINWLNRKWDEYFWLRGRKRPGSITPEEHARFDKWLEEVPHEP